MISAKLCITLYISYLKPPLRFNKVAKINADKYYKCSRVYLGCIGDMPFAFASIIIKNGEIYLNGVDSVPT